MSRGPARKLGFEATNSIPKSHPVPLSGTHADVTCQAAKFLPTPSFQPGPSIKAETTPSGSETVTLAVVLRSGDIQSLAANGNGILRGQITPPQGHSDQAA